jgi:NAD-dependent dihydropyrimidine dehydrogenase PreA subunit
MPNFFPIKERRRRMSHLNEKHEILEEALSSLDLAHPFSRRQFLKLSGVSIIGISALGPLFAKGATKPLIIMEQTKGIIIADPTKCVGCRRCELACTEFNDGKAKPSMSRVKVARNLNFGPKGIFAEKHGQGNWGTVSSSGALCQCVPE